MKTSMKTKYDIIIVGAGPSGVFCAYEIKKNAPYLDVLLVEKGNSIDKKVCPKRTTGKCINCKNCSITTGFSGAGAFSDGKLTLATNETGGRLAELIGEEKARGYINRMDKVYLKLGADERLHGVNNPDAINKIRTKAIRANMKLVESPIRHLGTEQSYEIYKKLQEELQRLGVVIAFNTMVKDLVVEDNKIIGVLTQDTEIFADTVVVATGREGSHWFKKMCDKHNIKTSPGTVDLGVRVECRDEVMKELNEAMYESKLIYHTKTYADKVRTFCQNPSGEVALENYNMPDGTHIVTVNGHAYKDNKYKTNNTNFALLVSKNFTEPFKEPLEYGAAYARIANMLSGGKALVQTYGDLKRGRRSTPERLKYGNVIPTLKDAEAGDLSLVLPHRVLVDIVEMIEAMDIIVPGIANDETLLYGVEVKFYSNNVCIDKNCMTTINGLYAIGDSSSWTRGLAQSSAMGLYVGDIILNNKNV